jgi:sec-independent protein translocase protein TatB
VFGLSFGEICVLVIVAIVVIGPKDLPKALRKAGQLAGKVRRMATDVRTQSGIDEVLREGSLHEDIAEIRKLAQADFLAPVAHARLNDAGSYGSDASMDIPIVREREYPREGADGYGAMPDTAVLYAQQSKPSALASDPLYMLGDASATLAPPEPTAASPEPLSPAQEPPAPPAPRPSPGAPS